MLTDKDPAPTCSLSPIYFTFCATPIAMRVPNITGLDEIDETLYEDSCTTLRK